MHYAYNVHPAKARFIIMPNPDKNGRTVVKVIKTNPNGSNAYDSTGQPFLVTKKVFVK